MKALQYIAKDAPLAWRDVADPTVPGAVVVDLQAAALNHRDVFITQGLYPGIVPDRTLGSDGAGWVGERAVIINPNVGWGDNPRFPDRDYTILGMPTNGTFAEKIAVASDRLIDKPAHLSMAQSAALPLAGLTAYRVLMTRCRLQPGERVLISGIGGGVALIACQFAIAAGAEVFVTSSSEAKIAQAVALGAQGGANYRNDGWARPFGKETGGFDVIIDSAGGPGFGDLVRLTRPGARIGLYGSTVGSWERVPVPNVFFRQLDILGSSMGTDAEFAAMVEFVNRHAIVPVIDSVYPLAAGNDALARMADGEQFGKIVLQIGA